MRGEASTSASGTVFFDGNTRVNEKHSRYSGSHGTLMFYKVGYTIDHAHAYSAKDEK